MVWYQCCRLFCPREIKKTLKLEKNVDGSLGEGGRNRLLRPLGQIPTLLVGGPTVALPLGDP